MRYRGGSVYEGVGSAQPSFGNVVGICESSSVLRRYAGGKRSAEGGGTVG